MATRRLSHKRRTHHHTTHEMLQHLMEQVDHLWSETHTLTTQGRKLVMASAELKAALKKIDTATDNIAADIQRLKEKIGTGMSDADVASVQAEADRIADRLTAIAADTEDPTPV